MSNNPYFKNNSFSKTPGAAQIASYVVFLLQSVLFYAVLLPHLESPSSKAILAVLYTISLLALIIFALVSSFTDPSDEAMIIYRNNRENFQFWRETFEGRLLFCDHCLSYVKEKSRHCRACDRCVQNFDHHCMWINNCVGDLNYRSFFGMIISAFAHLSIYVIAMVVLTLQRNFGDFLGGFVVSWVSGAINGVFAFLLVNLIILHFYLIAKGISTYEFIVAQRQEQKKKKDEQQQKKRGSESQKVVFPAQVSNKKPAFQENTNVQFTEKRKVSRKLQDNQDDRHQTQQPNMIRVQSKSTVQKDERIIFGQKDLTQKSEGKLQKEEGFQNDASGESDGTSMQLSQLMIRNKSLKLIIGQNNYYKPHRVNRDQNRAKIHSTLK